MPLPDINLEPSIVGRGDEIARLSSLLVRAEEWNGSLTMISGEAGVGKTRLVEELKGVARSRGHRVLSSRGTFETLTPYMPFVEALRSGGLEPLFDRESPRVESMFLVTKSGLLIEEVMRNATMLDPDIFASMLTTVGDFVKETMSILSGEERRGTLNTLGYEGYRIVIEAGHTVNLVLILTGRENESLIGDLRELLAKVEDRYGAVLADWDGDEGTVEGARGILEPLITSGKYDGAYDGGVDPKARRDQLFDNVAMGLSRASQAEPLLLCMEDLQWADPSTMALMHHVARHTRDSRVTIVGTYRPEDLVHAQGEAHPLTRTMEMMELENLLERMELRRLPATFTDEFISNVLGDTSLEPAFVEMIYKETEGNPLFITQLLGYLVDEAVIVPRGNAWAVDRERKGVDVPSKLYHLISRRLDRVGEEHRRVLDYASVLGVAFSSSILANALEMDRGFLLEQLRDIERMYLLIHPENGSFRFDHNKIKEVLYDRIPLELRREYHARVAHAIENAHSGDPADVVGDLAFHYSSCRDVDRALHYLLAAARAAKGEYSNDEAIRLYLQALEFVKDAQTRFGILMDLAQLHVFVGSYQRSLGCYGEALNHTSPGRGRAEVLARMGGVFTYMGEYDRGIDTCMEALRLVGDQDCAENGLIHGTLGILYEKKRDYRRAIHHLGLVSKYKRSA